MSFAEDLERLEEIVRRLEGDQLPLEEALGIYEEGVIIARKCFSFLEDARRRIEILSDLSASEGEATQGED
ncbi:exodeoxyribonuclease VII small subunit [Thermanaerovibrio acidaminovorans]|jgi:exodeoxyribonuclease VII small subunit|uniref:exodeoxyribonuclease VII small subunit n=1 Tax=Thermanaerovibrio acidaminovorans TaxID=81462 RepID=UPI002493B6DF|nr:exodeoxyribonuclease VII small subunit [Thermanaerovibrio acidaminovorans]